MSQTALDHALAYVKRGWRVLALAPGTKGPRQKGWPDLALCDEEAVRAAFNGSPRNVGVLLGVGGLCDVDLDCAEALTVAGYFLPETKMMFGRASKRMSHRIYVTDGLAERVGKAVLNFDDPDNPGPHMLELRVGGVKGAQTVFPGSIHESGEPIAFEPDFNKDPAEVNGAELIGACKRVAAAALIARAWPVEGGHRPAQVLGGFLARAGMDATAVELFARAVLAHVGGPNAKDHVRTARSAAEGRNRGGNAYGFLSSPRRSGRSRPGRLPSGSTTGRRQPASARQVARASRPPKMWGTMRPRPWLPSWWRCHPGANTSAVARRWPGSLAAPPPRWTSW